MTVPGKLTVQPDGRVSGPAKLEYNSPFPCVNGSWGSGSMMGAVLHTMVGQLAGADAVFNNPSMQASAHFGIAQDGTVKQWGPIGKGWIAWHAYAANEAWYGIEHADNGNTENPLTAEQITASAQVFECLSGYAGFALAVTDNVNAQGYGYHSMSDSWNLSHHSCPGPGPRAGQRAAIVALAKEIRAGNPPPSGPYRHIAAAGQTLGEIAAGRATTAGHLLSLSAREYTAADEAALAALKLPAGTPYYTSNPG